MSQATIKQVLKTLVIGKKVIVKGWVRSKRVSKRVAFIILQDGSSQQPLQIVADPSAYSDTFFTSMTVGASLAVDGTIAVSQGKNQSKELQATKITLLGEACAEAYPLQPKRHTTAFLRSIQHLRFRTNLFGAVFRVRHALSYAIHDFFHRRGFYHVHTPIITSLDAEGAGELFSVDTDKNNHQTPFFGKHTYLTVSGQLAAEAAALGLGKVYTFGPTFRAENSNTTRHLSEFWMVEPEMAFYDLHACIDLAEVFIKHLIDYVLGYCQEELAFLEKYHASTGSLDGRSGLCEQLEAVYNAAFIRITYDHAFDLLKKASAQEPSRFAYGMHRWGVDLQTEHERYLVEHFGKPVVVTDYPKDAKPFYMREHDDRRRVACMDILLPRIGEVIGGSQREERYERLLAAMKHKNMALEPLAWYLDTRRFGSVVHSGFGLGFGRFVQFITGVENIRDTIPFPRTPGHASC